MRTPPKGGARTSTPWRQPRAQDGSLERKPHSSKRLKWRRRAQETIVSRRIVRPDVRHARRADPRGIAQNPPGRILAIEEIVDRREDFEVRHGPVGRVQTNSRVAGDRRELV